MISPRSLSKLFNVQFSIILTLFLAFSVVGCGGCDSPTPKGKKTTDNPKDTPKNFKKVVALLHGLGAPGDLVGEEAKLKKDLPGYEIIRLVRQNSTQVSTTQQADEMYHQLKDQIKQKGLTDPAICLMGDSHGGLVALELYRKYKDQLNIVGIITNHSPLEGSPGVDASPDAIENFKQAFSNILVGSGNPTLVFAASFLQALDLKNILTKNIQSVVRQDLTPGSPLLANIKSTLSSIQIPVLILAGNVDIKVGILTLLSMASVSQPLLENIIKPLEKTLDKLPLDDPMLKQLEETFGKVIGNKENDCFLPYCSQTAKNIPASPTVKGLWSKDYHHFYSIAGHQKMYPKILEFINQAFETKK
ncbi:MAG: hypothetical protein BGO68_00440 [Candidatus Amoebophilus sp. 36-38]|nr:MAG: hypothetical protein BGO68_00440 [Candidatus Amoebophilus sp. 36-38]